MTINHTEDFDFVQSLRALADFLEDRPTLASRITPPTLWVFCEGEPEFLQLTRSIGGFDKKATDNFLSAVKTIGRVKLDVTIGRSDMCERKQVGTRTVEVEEYPADITPTVKVVEEPVYEWVCPPSWIS